METRPPKIAEQIAALLIPPACHEQVLGDLAERYTTPPRYLRDVISLLPYLAASCIRRTWNPQLALIESFAVFVSYAAATLLARSNGAELIRWIGLAVMITMAALALADAYGSHGAKVRIMQVLFASALAFAFLMILKPASAAVWSTGAVFCSLLLCLGRLWLPTGGVSAPASASTDMEQRARAFEIRIRKRNLREHVAAMAVIVGFASFLMRNGSERFQVSYALIICGAVFNLVYLHRNGGARKLPRGLSEAELVSFYRSELRRQHHLLRTVWSWGLAPFLPGLATFVTVNFAAHPGGSVAIVACAATAAAVIVMIWSASRHAAEELQREIRSLE